MYIRMVKFLPCLLKGKEGGMIMIKRIICLLLIASAISGLVGCSNGPLGVFRDKETTADTPPPYIPPVDDSNKNDGDGYNKNQNAGEDAANRFENPFGQKNQAPRKDTGRSNNQFRDKDSDGANVHGGLKETFKPQIEARPQTQKGDTVTKQKGAVKVVDLRAGNVDLSIIEFMESHSTKNKNIRHTHVCGKKYFEEIKKKYPYLVYGKNGCIIKPYIDEMALITKAADVIISRAGAMTIAEISAAGAAAILIPSPNVTNNHQYKNAKLLYDKGAAIMIEESELNERTLSDAVKKLETDMRLRKKISEAIKDFCVLDSGEIIANEVLSLGK